MSAGYVPPTVPEPTIIEQAAHSMTVQVHTDVVAFVVLRHVGRGGSEARLYELTDSAPLPQRMTARRLRELADILDDRADELDAWRTR